MRPDCRNGIIASGLLCMTVVSAYKVLRAETRPAAAAAPACVAAPTSPPVYSELLKLDSERVFVVAHRGDWRNAPENSIRAIESALRMGADLVEVDVRLTRDEKFVLMHDDTLNRTTTGSGPVDARLLTEVTALRLRNGQGKPTRHKPPTLRAALNTVRGHGMLVLDKCDGYLSRVLELVEVEGCLDHVVVSLGGTAAEARVALGCYADKVLFMPNIWIDREDGTQQIAEFEQHLPPFAYTLLFRSDQSFDPLRVARLKERGRRIWVNAIWPHHNGGHDDDLAADDPESTYGWLLGQGVDMIQSDRPQQLIAYLDKHERRPAYAAATRKQK